MLPDSTRCLIRSCAGLEPPKKGAAESVPDGHVGASESCKLGDSGDLSASMIASRLSGISKGSDCGGMYDGNGGSFDTLGSTFRGAFRSGSTVLRKVVNTSESSLGSWNGKS